MTASALKDRAHLFAVAGLLHDVGKLLEPAGITLEDRQLRMESDFCPTFNGRPSHRHVLYTALAIDRSVNSWGGLPPDRVYRIACSHHRPSGGDFDEHILQAADWLASGHDRRDVAKEDEATVTGLRSPLVAAFGHQSSEGDILPTRPLAFGEDDYLPGTPGTKEDYRRQCREMSELFMAALSGTDDSPEACVRRLLAVSQRFLHAIPQSRSWTQRPDVSRFDHNRTVAAFAACMAAQLQNGECDANWIISNTRFRVVGLRLRSIQDFIFRSLPPLEEPGSETRAASGDRGMARTLRARSMMLSLATMAAARRVLDATGMPLSNILLDAGGRCLILLPDTPETVTAARQSLQDIRRWMRENLLGTAVLDAVLTESIPGTDFQSDRFAACWDGINRTIESARTVVADTDLLRDGQWNESAWIESTPGLPVDRDAGTDRSDTWAARIASIGGIVPHAVAVAFGPVEGGSPVEPTLDLMGRRIQLHDQTPSSGDFLAIRLPDDPTVPFSLVAGHLPLATERDVDWLTESSSRSKSEEDEDLSDEDATVGRPLTFNHLARLAAKDTIAGADNDAPFHRHTMLATLKADVDRLGLVMSAGLRGGSDGRQESLSIGRLATMSRTLDLFFKGFLDQQLRTRHTHIYTVFAGGDDLFLIGPWRDILRLAADLHGWFSRLVAGHDRITISAGIAFAQPRTPVRTIAAMGEAALEHSKHRGRNLITVADCTLTWDAYRQAMELAEALSVGLAGGGEARRSLLYRVLQYGISAGRVSDWQADRSATPPGFADLKWRSQMAYDLRRNLGGSRVDPAVDQLRKQLMAVSQKDGRIMQVAATTALYSIRGESS